MENVIYFGLDISYQFDVSHDRNLEGILAVMNDNGEYETMIRIEKPLIKARDDIDNGQVGASLDIGDYF